MGGTTKNNPTKKSIVTKKQTARVDEIVIDEVAIADENLEQDDKKIEQAKKDAKKKAKMLRTSKEKKKLRRIKVTIVSILGCIIIGVLLGIPHTRWPILNAIGFRSTLNVQIVDEASGRPVSRAMVRVADREFLLADKNGTISFSGLRLGKQRVEVQRIGYGNKTLKVTNGLRSTNVSLLMTVIGIKLDVDVKDWLSGRAIEGAEVIYKDASAVSDKTGRASIVIPPQNEQTVRLDVQSPGYLSKSIKTDVTVESRELSMVSAQKNYFMSKRDGKFDIFSSYLDGTNQQKIIQATGKEDERFMQFAIDRTNSWGLLVATREGSVVNDRIVAGVYSIDLKNATLKKIDEGTDVQLLGWGDDSMSYRVSSASLGYDDPGLTKIINFNPRTQKKKDLAQTNYFAVSIAAKNKVFYAKSDPYRDITDAALTSVDVSSGKTKTYLESVQLRYISRPSYDAVKVVDINGASSEIQLDSGQVKAVARTPLTTVEFATSPNGQTIAWVDSRDGQGLIIQKSLQNNQQSDLLKLGGLTTPIRFVSDDLLIARVVTSQETADYVVSLITGRSQKVVDVTQIKQTPIDSL